MLLSRYFGILFLPLPLPLPLQEVCRLYRASLKLLDSWAVDRTIFNEEATKIRASVRASCRRCVLDIYFKSSFVRGRSISITAVEPFVGCETAKGLLRLHADNSVVRFWGDVSHGEHQPP